jgi:hypothetical protein
MDLYFGFGVVYSKEEARPASPLIEVIDSGDSCVAVLKESVRKASGEEKAGPIGISSMNACFLGYLEEFMHALGGFGGRPDWILFRAFPQSLRG